MLSKVVVGTDFSSTSEAALDHAAMLARNNGAELHVVHVRAPLAAFEAPHAQANAPERERYEQHLEQQARHALEDVQAQAPVTVKRQLIEGKAPEEALVDYAQSAGANLIVLGTHGRRGLPRLVLGSVAERVVRTAPLPVLVVPPGAKLDTAAQAYSRILSPIDFSAASHAALQHAAQLAQQHAAKLYALHVVEAVVYPTFYTPHTPGPTNSGALTLTRQAAEQLEAWLRRLPANIQYEVLIGEGEAQRVIIDDAKHHAIDLIVMATAGLSGMRRVLLGSVTERVVRQAPCPVLVTRASEAPS